MVEVRLRDDGIGSKARRLCDWPVMDLAALISTVEGWGVLSASDTYSSLYGQFVLDNDGAYFELVIPDDNA